MIEDRIKLSNWVHRIKDKLSNVWDGHQEIHNNVADMAQSGAGRRFCQPENIKAGKGSFRSEVAFHDRPRVCLVAAAAGVHAGSDLLLQDKSLLDKGSLGRHQKGGDGKVNNPP